MKEEGSLQKKSFRANKRSIAIASVVALVLVGVLLVRLLDTPKRSVEGYCKVYAEEKARLSKLPGETWSSGVFNDKVSDASEFANSFRRLAQVAPDEIRPDVATLQSIYQKIHDEPSQAISASLSGVSAEDSVKAWTTAYCVAK